MRVINKAVALACVSTFAAGATTVIFNGCKTTPNEYFDFTPHNDISIHDIEKVSIKQSMLNTLNTAVPREVTLIIPGQFNHNGAKIQTSISERAFAELKHPGLRIKIITQITNGQYVWLPERCSELFHNSTSITDIDLSGVSPNTEIKATREMFWGCMRLKNIKFANFNTSKVTNMESMFHYCISLEKLDLSSFNTQKVKNMHFLFGECNKLKNLNISNFDTRNVRTMQSMFSGCRSLESLDLRKFDTSQVETMAWMFNDCKNLHSLNVSKFNTAKVTDMLSMFRNCNALSTLDLLNFNFNKVEFADYMFDNCHSLQYINIKDNSIISHTSDSNTENLLGFNK